ncbi:hypothetical protein A3A69_01160, partial [candidate division WWE3 bacterium RIFCSPLOWO2_01_FULL_37_15]
MEIAAENRTQLGKKSKKLRLDRKLPAVMFSKGVESLPLTVDFNQFVKLFNEAGETTLVDLKHGGSSEKVLIKDLQLDPVTGNPIHVSFQKVNLKEKITADIPVEIVGEEKNELLKSGEGLVLQLLNEITVEALPTDLPHKFEVDVSKITEVGEGLKISDLEYDREKVELIDHEPDELVVKIDKATMEEE